MATTFIARPWNGLAYQKLLVNTVNLKGLARGHKYEIWKIFFFWDIFQTLPKLSKKTNVEISQSSYEPLTII